KFGLKWVLRLGIILLGIRLSLGDVLRLGAVGVPLVMFCIAGAIVFTRWLSNRLGLSGRMGTLIAVGTSICGTSAIVATGPAIEAKDEEMTYAIANITLFGVLAMFLYPFLAHGIFADDLQQAGLFLGTSIHETAQVAGSGLIYADQYNAAETLDVATITKLVRNVLIAVVIPLMSYQYHRQQRHSHGERKSINPLSLFPLFILGFLLMAVVRSVGDATLDSSGSAYGVFSAADWDALVDVIRQAAEISLAVAMAGVGLGTTFRQLQGLGLKPFIVGLGASVAVGGFSLAGILVLSGLGLT
ncbi:MAG: YeiH family protein, partial [Anaerolineales bacterium]